MNLLIKDFKLLVLNFKLRPQQALINSYKLTKSYKTSIAVVILLALLSGVNNVLFSRYLPVRILKYIDKVLEKYDLDFMKNSLDGFKTQYLKQYLIGAGIFIAVLLLVSIFTYAIKTSFFKESYNFISIVQISVLPMIPTVVLCFISSLMLLASLLMYSLFMIITLIVFIIYLYENISNISSISQDALCFLCAIFSVVIICLVVRLSVNVSLLGGLTSTFSDTMKEGAGL